MGFIGGGSEIADGSISASKLAPNIIPPIKKAIGLNGLNILDVTAEANLTAGTNANFERDVYTESKGYLDTIDETNTSANHGYSSETYNGGSFEGWGGFTTNCIALTKGYISRMGVQTDGPNNWANFVISQNGKEIYNQSFALESQYSSNNFNLDIADYTQPIEKGPFTISCVGSDIGFSSSQSFSGNYFKFSNQNTTSGNKGSLITFTAITTGAYTNQGDNAIVKINSQTIESGFTKFMIVANEETSGTGSVTYDITFDGTNYQEDLEAFTEYSIENAGTSLILKQKLNAGASSGIASAYNWGVLLW